MLVKKHIKIAQLLRIKHWIKNVFIFAPLMFSGKLFSISHLYSSLKAFFGFCLVTSSIYIINDFLDSDSDRLHPAKRNRFFVNNQLPNKTVILIVLTTMFMGFLICNAVNFYVFFTALVYVIVNLFYNFWLKKIMLLDVAIVAIGFIIRIWVGAFAVHVLPSSWLQICIFILALLLGFSKRKCEILDLKEKALSHRTTLAQYTPQFLDQLITMCATLTIIFYFLYTISSGIIDALGNYLMSYSVVFVIFGIYRYLYLVNIKKFWGDPGELFFLDKIFVLNILLWISYITLILYYSTSTL